MAGRVTQLVVEAVIAATDANVRVTQIAVEAVIAPTSQNLVVSQVGLEVARTGYPTLLVSQAGFEVAYELPKGTFTLGAVIRAEVSSSFAANAVHETPDISSSFTAGALLLKTFSFGPWVQSGWADPGLYEGLGITVDAVKIPGFFVNAYIAGDLGPKFLTVDAILLRVETSSTTIRAVLLVTNERTVTVNAAVKRTMVAGWSLDAIIMPVFKVDALLLRTFPGSFTTRANLFATIEGSLTLDAYLAAWFTLDAFIPISVNAWIDLGFFANAVIKRTMGVPGILPLSYPGVSRTLYGNTANALTPLFPVGTDELMMVKVVTPPSDGGDLGAFNATRTLNYGITASPGDYWFSVIAGEYYIYSSKNNVYRPGLTGSGTYANWGVSSLQVTLDAFVQPVFRVDANFVWTFTFPVTFDATLRKTMSASFSVGAFIQPFMLVDAEIVPLHFTVGAWIKCEFPLDAWLIRRVVSSFPANAFVQPAFRVNAVRRKVQAKTFAVSSWFTNPRYGNFNVSAWILHYTYINASIRLTKYRRFTASSWKILHATGSLSADAFVQPTFRTDAVIYRPAESLDPVPSFTLDTRLVKLVFGDFAVDAFIEGYARIDAIKLETFTSSVVLDAAMVWKIYGSFTVGAGITGFLTNAVIKARQTAIFTLFAWKDILHPTRSFLVQAERRDPGAYWDPETETWLHMHFLVDALLEIHPAGSVTVDATLIEGGKPLGSFTADSLISSPEMYGELLLEAEISTHHTVVYEGSGEVVIERHLITERLSFPGAPNPPDGKGYLANNDANNIYGPFYPIDQTPVTITIWDIPSYTGSVPPVPVGIHSPGANLYQWISSPTTLVFWPSYSFEEHYVYTSKNGPPYDPSFTGSGMISFYRDDAVTLSLPAPTLDAWIVGTLGAPFTLDAEIVEREKLGFLYLDADLMKAGEQRGTFDAGAHLMAPQAFPFFVFAAIVPLRFTADAVIHQPNLTADAFIQPYFTVNAVIMWTFSWYPLAPAIDAVLVMGQGSGSFAAGAEIIPSGELRGTITLEALVLGPRTKRFYLAAVIPVPAVAFAVDAFIGHNMAVDAWIGSVDGGMGSFPLGAYIRGNSIIIFPDDGGPPTSPTGGPPAINRSFRVKIEAFIPDPIPIGNDREIEELIMKILEAEAELDSLLCAVDHYSSQDSTVSGGRNSYGGGYTGSLPNAISQIGYPGAGDIDDCWVVATVWAAIASGQTFQPTVPQFRSWARNPDRPGATGGTLDHVMRGARGAWPGATIRRFASSDWNGFISLLKAGWTASLAVRSSGLPSNLRYGFNGLHQVGVAYQNGSYVIMNPLQSTGSSLHTIDGYDLRTAARGFTGGTICACMFR